MGGVLLSSQRGWFLAISTQGLRIGAATIVKGMEALLDRNVHRRPPHLLFDKKANFDHFVGRPSFSLKVLSAGGFISLFVFQ